MSKLFAGRVVWLQGLCWLSACGIAAVASAQTRTIRVVTSNIAADINGATTPLPGLIAPSSGGSVTNGGVLEGIGEEIINGDPAQPIDILTLQETTSNAVTVQPIVDGLNAFYSSRSLSAGYAMSSYQATTTGGTGGGPNAMVYNTNTLQLVASVGVGTPGSNGVSRQVVRYAFAPAGVTPTTNNEFYVYVSHYKSGTTTSDVTARNGEAQVVRADSATLPSNARILYTGDFNASTSGEAMYQTLVAAGVNQGYDVLNPTGLTTFNWGSTTTDTNILAALSESATNLRYRDDYQMMTSNVLYGVAGGLAYVPGTYHVFGNNGTTPYNGSVNSGSNTALNNNLTTNVTGITASQLYQYLTTASDHLPAVADYTIPIAAPYSPQSIQTVFIILMENTNWSAIKGSAAAPYINNALLPKAAHAEQYFTPTGLHPSLPNYLWLEAGTNFGVRADADPSAYHQSTTNHLVTLLKNAGISWTSYQEDISGASCPLTAVNQYAPKHNPMVYFDDVTNTNNASFAYCIANVRPFTELATDLQSNIVTRYNFITPNLCDDMHGNTGCPAGNLITQGDTWLSNNIPVILNSQAYSNNGAVFLVWDEGSSSSDGPIGMIVLSPLAKGAGYSNTIHYTHSSTLRTVQEIFNVGPLLNDAANAADLADLFIFAPQLAVSPAAGLTSSGNVGGPFSPSNQTYTVSNTGGTPLSWTASNTTNWLSLSATSGTLAAGAGTNITVSINTNANSLSSGIYSDTVTFTNTTNGAGSTTRAVSLTINSPAATLSVIPSTGLNSAGPPGGPFSPTNQTYTLSNLGGATLIWTANNTANWLTLSATNGTLAQAATTNVTASINGNATNLTVGVYADTIGFTNTTNGTGNTTRAVSLTVSSTSNGFFDDVENGTNSWTASGLWHIVGSTGCTNWFSPTHSWWYGNDANCTYSNGVTNTGDLISPQFVVPSSGTLTFQSWEQTEGTTTSWDKRFVHISTNNAVTWNQLRQSTNNAAAWYPVAIDLGGYAGKTAQLRFRFDTINSSYNNYGGWYLDDIRVAGPPALSVTPAIAINAAGNQGGPFTPASQTYTLSNTGGSTLVWTASVSNNWLSLSAVGGNLGAGANTSVTVATNANASALVGGLYSNLVSFVNATNGTGTTNAIWTLLVRDGIPDAWRLQYFGHVDPRASDQSRAADDPDGDGFSNLQEYLAGTDPTNAAAYFHISSITVQGADVGVTWMMGPERTNALQVATGADTGGFTNGFTDLFIVTNTAGTVTNYIDPGAATNSATGYYRIRIVP